MNFFISEDVKVFKNLTIGEDIVISKDVTVSDDVTMNTKMSWTRRHGFNLAKTNFLTLHSLLAHFNTFSNIDVTVCDNLKFKKDVTNFENGTMDVKMNNDVTIMVTVYEAIIASESVIFYEDVTMSNDVTVSYLQKIHKILRSLLLLLFFFILERDNVINSNEKLFLKT
jgi:hypothetical protein